MESEWPGLWSLWAAQNTLALYNETYVRVAMVWAVISLSIIPTGHM